MKLRMHLFKRFEIVEDYKCNVLSCTDGISPTKEIGMNKSIESDFDN
jgi:hypothetical protein